MLLGIFIGSVIALPATATCAHSYTSTVETPAKALVGGVNKYTCTKCGDTYTEAIPATKTLKILAIGNSFSVDAMQYLWDIANNGGVETVVLGNLYIGGCSIEKHATNIANASASYTYYKNTSGTWDKTDSTSVQTALADEEWDIVTVQQSSNNSGVADSYSRLGEILTFLKKNKPNADIYFHMTWAYQSDSTHSGFANYSNNQTTMYNAIQNAIDSKVKTDSRIVGIIPSGTAIQNLRTSYIGDTVTRDGYHLSYDLGRYTAALTWYTYFTGAAADTVSWVPEAYAASVSPNLTAIREAVAYAIFSPYKVTTVTTTLTDGKLFKTLGHNINSYKKIDWVLKVHGYYNASSSVPFDIICSDNSSASNIPNFIASHKFTKETLPVGSIVIMDSGYRYRPEGWIGVDYSCTSSQRPALVTDTAVEITDEWWGDYTYRAFNFSATTAREIAASEAIHLRIYVPLFPDIKFVATADTNSDGVVTLPDVLVSLKSLLNHAGSFSDVNGDGLPSLLDCVLLLKQTVK